MRRRKYIQFTPIAVALVLAANIPALALSYDEIILLVQAERKVFGQANNSQSFDDRIRALEANAMGGTGSGSDSQRLKAVCRKLGLLRQEPVAAVGRESKGLSKDDRYAKHDKHEALRPDLSGAGSSRVHAQAIGVATKSERTGAYQERRVASPERPRVVEEKQASARNKPAQGARAQSPPVLKPVTSTVTPQGALPKTATTVPTPSPRPADFSFIFGFLLVLAGALVVGFATFIFIKFKQKQIDLEPEKEAESRFDAVEPGHSPYPHRTRTDRSSAQSGESPQRQSPAMNTPDESRQRAAARQITTESGADGTSELQKRRYNTDGIPLLRSHVSTATAGERQDGVAAGMPNQASNAETRPTNSAAAQKPADGRAVADKRSRPAPLLSPRQKITMSLDVPTAETQPKKSPAPAATATAKEQDTSTQPSPASSQEPGAEPEQADPAFEQAEAAFLQRQSAEDLDLSPLWSQSPDTSAVPDGEAKLSHDPVSHPVCDSVDDQSQPLIQFKKCPECGASFSLEAKFCDSDKTPLVTTELSSAITMAFGGRYQILAVIGRGGMSMVYHAMHKLLKKQVAIKLMDPRLVGNTSAIRRFQREAQVVSRLSHPNIVAVHDFGITADGQPYMVMDFVAGKTLAKTLAEELTLPQSRVKRIALQCASGLGQAHRFGIIHRDMKPNNIVLDKNQAGDDLVKIVDFGVAKMSLDPAEPNLTQAGEIFGTIVYMSPEQCRGQMVDHRSDIFSLGSVMFEMVSGRPPFAEKSALDTLRMIVSEATPSIRDRRPTIMLAGEMEYIIQKCLEKDPDKRYQNMEALMAALVGVPDQAIS